ncbi:hypothetical protein WMY93_029590 [Mugilogobius chulae]|uniref:SAM domain-containing protein n=1 Tax=Mugilogobius chulae TaxID=88201 RepID=A0AAW0MX46_9GOBI
MKNKVTGGSSVGLRNKSWSWQQYLDQHKSTAAPTEVFNQYQWCPSRRSCGFKVGQKLEGVDPFHPNLFCVLSVAEVIGCRLRLHIDGFSESYDFWVNSDSPEIRPIGFCRQSQRRLEPPKGVSEEHFDWSLYLQETNSEAAPASAFRPDSHVVSKPDRDPSQSLLFGCPYSDTNLRKDQVLPDRLGPEPGPGPGSGSGSGLSLLPQRRLEEVPLKRRKLSHRVCAVTPAVIKQELKPGPDPVLVQSRFLSALSPQPSRDLSLCWDQHRKLLPRVPREQAPGVHRWTVAQVSDFIQSLPGCEDQAQHFRNQEIDGRAFLLLTQRDILQILSIKLGPALKIYHSILMFRHERSQSERREGERSQSERREGERSQSERREGERGQSERREGREQSERREGERGQSERREGEHSQSERREGERGQSERREGERSQSERREENAANRRGERENAANRRGERENAANQRGERENAANRRGERENAANRRGERERGTNQSAGRRREANQRGERGTGANQSTGRRS